MQQKDGQGSRRRNTSLLSLLLPLVAAVAAVAVCSALPRPVAVRAQRTRDPVGTPRSTSSVSRAPQGDSSNPGDGGSEALAGSSTTTTTTSDVPFGNRTEWTLAAFQSWFAQHGGGWSRRVRVVLTPSRYAAAEPELSIDATGELPPQAEVVRVPEKLLLHAGLLRGPHRNHFTDHEQLALVVVDELARGGDSLWYPYIRLLPAQLPCPLFFQDDDLQALAGTYAGVMANHMVQQYRRFEAKALKWAAVHRKQPAQQAVFTPRLLRWAVAMVHSRAFTIDKPKDPEHPLNGRPFLAPGADFLNHKSTARVGWSLGSRNQAAASVGGAFQIFALDGVQADHQVYNHYQDFGGAHLLSHYGFSIPDNENDFLPISLGLPSKEIGTPLGEYKKQLLRRLGLRQVQKLRPSGVSVSMLNVVRVLALDGRHDDWVEDGFDTTTSLLPVTLKEEAKSRKLLSDALSTLLRGIPRADAIEGRVRDLAHDVVVGVVTQERRLLNRALRWLLDEGAVGIVPPVGGRDAGQPMHTEL